MARTAPSGELTPATQGSGEDLCADACLPPPAGLEGSVASWRRPSHCGFTLDMVFGACETFQIPLLHFSCLLECGGVSPSSKGQSVTRPAVLDAEGEAEELGGPRCTTISQDSVFLAINF